MHPDLVKRCLECGRAHHPIYQLNFWSSFHSVGQPSLNRLTVTCWN